MSFEVGADAYGRFIGIFTEQLAVDFLAVSQARPGQSALDVGCGPGALTAALVDRLGAGSVAAVDPSASFVAAVRTRLPGVEVQQGSAEALPFASARFDLVMAQLVVHFMSDPVAGIAEMARVTRPGGAVAACVWDYAGGRGPFSVFWRAVLDLDPGARDESGLVGAREGQLETLFRQAGLREGQAATLTARADFGSFDEWWQPFTLNVGPPGAYVAALDSDHRDRLRARCAELLAAGPFQVEAAAWMAIGLR